MNSTTPDTAMAETPPPYRPSRLRRLRDGNWALNLLLIALALLMFVPFYWMIVNSLLPREKAFALPPEWFPREITLNNYREVFNLIPFGRLIFNSLKLTTIITVGSVTISTLAAYAFARLSFPGRDLLFIIMLSALMVPQQVTVIPTFILIKNLGLLDTHESIYLPGLINVFGTFLLRQFFLTIPRDLEDAAKLDGAGHLRILANVIVPLAAPAISALAIFTALAAWNEFFWANVFLTSPDKMTLPVGLVMISGRFGSGSPVVILAALSMIVIPLLILFSIAQRRITEGVAMTGLRG
ncbi:MAG TPA: carbohydrate ABC transporter permease [Thermomicrobiales bacterium]|nr:carbohydrate ABC transporter permease [Thermomicrobiales bacterium]